MRSGTVLVGLCVVMVFATVITGSRASPRLRESPIKHLPGSASAADGPRHYSGYFKVHVRHPLFHVCLSGQ